MGLRISQLRTRVEIAPAAPTVQDTDAFELGIAGVESYQLMAVDLKAYVNTAPAFSGTITGTPTWASPQAITLSTASQPNVTSLGTLTSLAVAGGVTAASVTLPNGQYYKGTRTSGGLVVNLLGIEAGTDRTLMTATGDFVVQNGSGDANFTLTTAGAASFRSAITGNLVGNVTGALTGNASTATALQTARTINGVAFDGTGNIVVSAGTVGTLTFGTYLQAADAVFGGSNATIATNATAANIVSTLVARNTSGDFAAGIITASLVGNVTGNVTGSSGSTTGNAATATLAAAATVLATPRAINGVNFDGSANITITAVAAAGTLTGATLATNVLASSLTSVGTLTSLVSSGVISSIADQGFGNTYSGKTWRWGTNPSGNWVLSEVTQAITVAYTTGAVTFAVGIAVTLGTSVFQGITATSVTLGNGQYYKATRTTGGLVVNLLGIESGTDRTMMTATNDFVIQDGSSNENFKLTTAGAGIFRAGVTATSFTGNLTGNVTGNVTGLSGGTTGNAATATVLQTARAINGVSFNGSADITITAVAAAGTLTGATLASNVLASSLTSVGTLTSLTTSGLITVSYSGATVVIKDTAAYSAGVSGPVINLQGLDSGSANTVFARIVARPAVANADRGFLSVYTRLDGVDTLTAQFATGLSLQTMLAGPLQLKNSDTYSSDTSGPSLEFRGKDNGGTDTNFGFIRGATNSANVGYLKMFTRVGGVTTLTATFGTGATTNVSFTAGITAAGNFTSSADQAFSNTYNNKTWRAGTNPSGNFVVSEIVQAFTLAHTTGAAAFIAGATFSGEVSGITNLSGTGTITGFTSIALSGVLSTTSNMAVNLGQKIYLDGVAGTGNTYITGVDKGGGIDYMSFVASATEILRLDGAGIPDWRYATPSVSVIGASTHKVPMWFNGSQFYLLLSNV